MRRGGGGYGVYMYEEGVWGILYMYEEGVWGTCMRRGYGVYMYEEGVWGIHTVETDTCTCRIHLTANVPPLG